MNDLVDCPRISIGLPVYNEERFIDASLRSLREQDYPNVDILICDNASTDSTLSICERHAAEDSRIRIDRAPSNRGAVANFRRAFDLARGKYFMWASGHDLWSPNLLSECASQLNQNEGACIAFACSRWIDADGAQMMRASGWTDTRGMLPAARGFTILWGNMHPILGLIRTESLRSCQPMQNLVGGDLVLLMELALRGDLVHAPKASWSRREFRTETRYEDKLQRYISIETNIVRSPMQRMFPLLQLPSALIRVVWRSGLPLSDRMMMLLALAASLPLRYQTGRGANAR